MSDSFVRNVPTPELRRLEFLVGEFAGNETLFPPETPPVSFHAHAKAEWEACDRHLMMEFFAQVPGLGPETIRVLFTYNRDLMKYQSWAFSPAQDEPIRYQGGFEGDNLVMISEPSQSHWGMVRLRYTYVPVYDDGYTLIGERWEPDGYVRHRHCHLRRLD